MASGNQGGGEGLGDDFFEQMLSVPVSSYSGGGRVEAVNYVGGGGSSGSDHDRHHGSMLLGLGPGDGSTHGLDAMGVGGGFREMGLPLGLNLDPTGSASSSFLKTEGVSCKPFGIVDGGEGVGGANLAPSPSSRIYGNDSMHLTSRFPAALGHMQQSQPLRPYHPPQVQLQQPFQGQAPPPSVPVSHPPPIRPKVRARRGQATDPHSIAERLRRERIAERLKALQELVPSCNKTDRAAMLDEIVDYVKFLKLQVKVLSMSRLGGGGAVAQLVADVPAPPSSMEGEEDSQRAAWERWTEDGTEEHVAKLMEEDIGSAMQFLQSKELCIMPISLASALFQAHPQDVASMVKPESDNPP